MKNNQSIEYVIYCRKSTDETSDHQKQSIPDQIKACMEYAKREGLTIKTKPKDFSLFESEAELERENLEEDITNRRIYQETKNLYIIKEQETAKVPGKRIKWRELIKQIKKGKIKGLISYSPDRQARNMLEGGELINCVDEDQVTLKYTNFHFENTASGKMMLGIWFVFSKQYSDKLSEDITRGNKSKVTAGKAAGRFKHGYIQNKAGKHEPNGKNFDLIKEAFQMKLNGEIEANIREFLNANGYRRIIKKTGEAKEIGKSALNDIFKDPFYYGKWVVGDSIINLKEVNEYYRPVVTEEEFQILQDRYHNNPSSKTNKTKTKDKYEEIRMCDVDFILTSDNYGLTFALPNYKRFHNKIKKANIDGKYITLKDIVLPHQIKYRCTVKDSKQYNVTMTQEDIDKAVIKQLKKINIGEKEFQQYIDFVDNRLNEITMNTKEKISKKTLEMGRIKGQKISYIKRNMSIKKDKDELALYENEKLRYDKKISRLTKEIEALNEGERNEVVELEAFIDILNNAERYYQKATYVQKKKIAKILFLNIKLDNKKRLQVQVKPGLETLFSSVWCSLLQEVRSTVLEFGEHIYIPEL